MNKSILKKFAIESRKELMDKISNKIKKYYVDEEFKVAQNGEICVLRNEKHTLSLTKKEYENRQLLIKRINEITLEQVIEEAAYTWFNRIIAIRYMEIHDYLPLTKDNQSLGIRVLSSKDNTPDPEIMKISNLINSELDIGFDKEYYSTIQDNNKRFEYILLLICKKLGKVIPQVFDGVTDYIDILIPDNLLNDSGYISKILKDISEENFFEVEIIGWLYQYYNQTEKDKVMSKNKSYEKNEIPYVTQLFTPDWIVKYMVQNSLGKYYVENTNDIIVKNNWEYYIESEKDNENYDNNFSLEDITLIDPCCGSGHILIYAFDLFKELYERQGYNKRNIAELILKNNLYGLEIDDRAAQLSVLSVILKAREYDKNIFNKNIVNKLMICSIQETNSLNEYFCEYFNDKELNDNLKYLCNIFKNAKEIGSLMIVEERDYNSLINAINNDESIFGMELKQKIMPLIKQAQILTKKFKIIVTNPPYMNSGVMSPNLKKYVQKNYSNYKTDLCTAFMNVRFIDEKGKLAMINQHSWMFLSSFEQMRDEIIKSKSISTMIHLGTRAFEEIGGEVVQTTTFVLENKLNKTGKFLNLTEVRDSYQKAIEAKNRINKNQYREVKLSTFNKMPGKVFAYWASDIVLNIFGNNKPIMDYLDARQGMATGDNNKFVRYWFEVDNEEIKFNCKSIDEFSTSQKKYVPYIKSSGICKWYGNYFNVLKFDDENRNLLANSGNHLPSKQYYFKNNFNWSLISTDKFGARISEHGGVFDVGAHAVFSDDENLLKKMGAFLNSSVFNYLIKFIGLTLNYNSGIVQLIPYIEPDNFVIDLVKENVNISKEIWDYNEISWDYKKNILVCNNEKSLSKCFENSSEYIKQKLVKLNKNENTLNNYFIKLYNLEEELKNVNDREGNIKAIDKKEWIRDLISYAVGCMFGRYSLEKEGLICAGGEINQNNYNEYKIDSDNIIPITENVYFEDDIVNRFKTFIEVIYGKDNLYDNLEFIAEVLGKKNGETNEETIRRYFINDFYNEHIKMYQKKPIYWLFDSGKKNGFKCLIYMHRYNKGTISKIRLDYLHKMQNTYEKELNEINQKLSEDISLQDKKELTKKQADLNAKLQETKEYDEKIAHIADQTIEIDLDDGVAVNYAKFSVKNPKTGKEESILANSKDIAIKKKKEE